jgi:murein endopeptidase
MPRRSPLPDFGVAPGQQRATAIGTASRGRLLAGVPLPKSGRGFRRINPSCFGTDQTIALVVHAAERLAARFPGTQPLLVGALSRESGGRSKGHASHQNGLDVDVAYLERGNPKRSHYKARVSVEEIDWEKMWFVFETWVLTGKLNYIFVDRSHLPHLRREARRSGWRGKQLQQLFGDGDFAGPDRVVRHWPGHTYHAHVRFVCPLTDAECEHSRY